MDHRQREPGPARHKRHDDRLTALDCIATRLRRSPGKACGRARQCAAPGLATPPFRRRLGRHRVRESGHPRSGSTSAPKPRQPVGPEACLERVCRVFCVFARMARGTCGAREAPRHDRRSAESGPAHCVRNARVCSRKSRVCSREPSRLSGEPRHTRPSDPPSAIFLESGPSAGSRDRPVPGAAAHAPLGLDH